MEILQQLKNVYTTLNQIEIKGESNVSYMFGSLSTLRDIIISLENVKKEGE